MPLLLRGPVRGRHAPGPARPRPTPAGASPLCAPEPPADLTLIAKRNGGKFDSDKVHRTIDGREEVKGHGGTDMPVWGDAFKRSVGSETSVKARIETIVDYLKSIEVK